MDYNNTAFASESARRALQSQYHGLSLQEVLVDLASRFVINVPPQELESMERVFWQVEQAYWFYEDFVRPARPDLPSFSNVRRFAHPILSLCEPAATFSNFDGDIYASYDAWQKYKNEVPTRGAILLNPSRDKVLLVKGWKSSASWGFPKGKIDEHESDRDCAVREVWEETGYDISPHFDPSRQPHSPLSSDHPAPLMNVAHLDRCQDWIDLEHTEPPMRLYLVYDVPEDTVFQTRTRKEISNIAWHPLKKLPGWGKGLVSKGRYWYVAAVVKLLKAKLASSSTSAVAAAKAEVDASFVDVDEGTRALQRFFLVDSQEPAENPPMAETATTLSFPDNASTGYASSIAADAEEHQRQRRRKQLLRNLDQELTHDGHSSGSHSLTGSPASGSAHHYSTHIRPRQPAEGSDLLSTLFASATPPSQYSSPTSHPFQRASNSQSQSPHETSPSTRGQHHVSPPAHLRSPQPQHYPSPLALFETGSAAHSDPFQAVQHHSVTNDPISSGYAHEYQSQAPASQPFAASQSSHVPSAPVAVRPHGFENAAMLSQPAPIFPIPLLSNFQSPPPQASQPQAFAPSKNAVLDHQQQANLLNLLNGKPPTIGPEQSLMNLEQHASQPNYPTGSPLPPHQQMLRSILS